MVQARDSYLDVQDVAKTLGISERKAWDLIYDKQAPLPHYRIGRKIVRVKTSELHEWMASNYKINAANHVDAIVDEILG